MAGVQGMPFTPGGLRSSANKEKGAFCLEVGSGDFFDQYVDLDEPDAGAASGGGGGLGPFYGASDYSMSPHFSFVGQMLPPDGAQAHSHYFSAEPIDCSAAPSSSAAARSSPQQPQPAHLLHRATSNMTAFSNPEIDIHGLPYCSFGEPPGGGGSISDSELLKLEGLTMRSPRLHMPQLSASEPASPPSKATSSRKAGRLKSACNRIRDAMTLHGEAKQADSESEPDSLSVPVMLTAQMEPSRMSGRPRPQNLQFCRKAELPSPPLTSGLPRDAQQANGGSDAAIVNGLLDAPYMADGLGHGQFVRPAQLSGSALPQTPLSTPLLNGWQLPLSTPDGKTLWAANPYLQSVNGDMGTYPWDPSADPMDTDLPVSYNAVNASYNMSAHLQHQASFEYPPPPGAANTNASFAANSHMLHMPQPQSVPPAVLHNDASSHRPTSADHHRRPKPRAPSAGARHLQYGPGLSPRKSRAVSGGTSASRIASVSPSPKPPVPSAVASLHRRSASLQTLNQPVPADGPASSAAIRKRRSWTGRRTSSSSSSLHHQDHTLAVAAARAASPAGSPSRRRTTNTATATATATAALSTTSRPVSGCFLPSSSSASPHSSFLQPHNITPTPNPNPNRRRRSRPHPHHSHEDNDNDNNEDENEEEENEYETSKADPDGFVNYTPRDSRVLMTGVAPSGSSKTKERRERAAREREMLKEREIEERVMVFSPGEW
ncbi:hypothetical protein N658DRAFT_484308 [Parathielavia hyrcaniae]|uniref:Developmental regulatory protein wetA n=1 Tax=Parathielavia hyrcaniae TaxID=113614 RepID=A0AAN6Q7I3_9PEZI|nr:hypothetical protein N658DRAFT_484308 [Parathielavia hyrcaniae]